MGKDEAAVPQAQTDTTQSNELSPKKLAAIDAITNHFGNIAKAAKDIGVHRVTIFRWRKDDPAFAAAYNAIEEYNINAVESALLARCAKDTTACIFYLCNRAKERWQSVNRQETTVNIRNEIRLLDSLDEAEVDRLLEEFDGFERRGGGIPSS